MKKTIDKLIPKCYTIIVKREVPTRDTKMGDQGTPSKKRPRKVSEKFPLDKPPKAWYNKSVKRERLVNSQSGRCFTSRKFLKKVKKPLDKLQKMCYNKYRKQEIRKR